MCLYTMCPHMCLQRECFTAPAPTPRHFLPRSSPLPSSPPSFLTWMQAGHSHSMSPAGGPARPAQRACMVAGQALQHSRCPARPQMQHPVLLLSALLDRASWAKPWTVGGRREEEEGRGGYEGNTQALQTWSGW
jgi:hypothetical protein